MKSTYRIGIMLPLVALAMTPSSRSGMALPPHVPSGSSFRRKLPRRRLPRGFRAPRLLRTPRLVQ